MQSAVPPVPVDGKQADVQMKADHLTEILYRLNSEELMMLWTAQLTGFLVAERPTVALIEIHSAISLLEGRPSVILLARKTRPWKIVTSVPKLEALPAFAERLAEGGAWILGVFPETGVISAAVGGGRAEAIARSLVPARVRRGRGLWE